MITFLRNFGKPNTIFDFSNHDIKKCKVSLSNLSERFQTLKKKINPKVINMIDGVEKKENALKTMVKTIYKDKRKIEETIRSLEDYKMEALQKTWKKVDRYVLNLFYFLVLNNKVILVRFSQIFFLEVLQN